MHNERVSIREHELAPGEIDYLFYFGSFNPFHLGHLHVLEAAREKLKPARGVILVPAYHHIWNKVLTEHEHRMQMTERAVTDAFGKDSDVLVSPIEKDLQLSGATIETLRAFQRQLPPGSHFGLLMGSDVVLTFNLWREWREVLKLAVVCVVPRDESKEEIIVKLPEELKSLVGKRIFILDVPKKKVVATQVRQQIKDTGVSPFISSSVMRYIQAHGLYKK